MEDKNDENVTTEKAEPNTFKLPVKLHKSILSHSAKLGMTTDEFIGRACAVYIHVADSIATTKKTRAFMLSDEMGDHIRDMSKDIYDDTHTDYCQELIYKELK